MDETEDTTETVDETAQNLEDTDAQQDGAGDESEDDGEQGAEKLLKALRAERKLRREAEKRANDLTAQNDLKDKSESEQEIERIRREAETAALGKANERVVKAEFKYAAKGKILNPDLAIRAIDFADVEVDEDGNVDTDSLAAVIDEFLERYPDQKADKKPVLGNSSIGQKPSAGGSEPSAKEIAKSIRV